MKEIYIKGLLCLLTAALAVGAVGCGGRETDISKTNSVQEVSSLSDAGETENISAENHRAPEVISEGQSRSSMGSVPYFRDDAGKKTQIADGFLYGYWNNRLCRYDLETLEETVLYEAASPQNGDFCIWGDYIYFMVIPNVNSVGKIHGYLYRVNCDGSEEAVRLASVRMPDQAFGRYCGLYELDTYGDILYLMQSDGRDNQYFRLNQDGSIAHVPESETLFGRLPQGYSVWVSDGSVSLPYAMRNYGYVFAVDENEKLVRIDPDSQQAERLDAIEDYRIWTITNDAFILVKDGSWYRASLDDINEIEKINVFETGSFVLIDVAWDEEGLYLVKARSNDAELFRLEWQGKRVPLNSGFTREWDSQVDIFYDGYYYYTANANGDVAVRRMNAAGDGEIEQVAVYYENDRQDMTCKETLTCLWTDEHTLAHVTCDITTIHLKEDEGACGKINDYLDDLYVRDMQAMEGDKSRVNEEEPDWENIRKSEAAYVERSHCYDVCYLDEDYIGIREDWSYFRRGAGALSQTVYYMFDMHTGERIFITDIVDDPPEEIRRIVAPYAEAAAAWEIDSEDWEDRILEQGRFFLSEEGIGIHFEFTSWSLVIVPYSEFHLKEKAAADLYTD